MYAAHQAARNEGKQPSYTLKDIGKLFGVHWTTVHLIGRRLSRADVPDEPEREDEGRVPKQPSKRTLKRRAKKQQT